MIHPLHRLCNRWRPRFFYQISLVNSDALELHLFWGHGRVTLEILSGCLAGCLICVTAKSCTVLLMVLVTNLSERKRVPKTYVCFPLPIAHSRISSLIDILVALSILMGYSVTTASFVTYVVREHQTKAKQLQHISGIGVTCYWVTNFIYDMVSNVCHSLQEIKD